MAFKVGDKVRVVGEANEIEVVDIHFGSSYCRGPNGGLPQWFWNSCLEPIGGTFAGILAPPPTPDTPTLRDQFAMSALGGLLAVFPMTSRDLAYGPNGHLYATAAYRLADAMLAARKSTGV